MPGHPAGRCLCPGSSPARHLDSPMAISEWQSLRKSVQALVLQYLLQVRIP